MATYQRRAVAPLPAPRFAEVSFAAGDDAGEDGYESPWLTTYAADYGAAYRAWAPRILEAPAGVTSHASYYTQGGVAVNGGAPASCGCTCHGQCLPGCQCGCQAGAQQKPGQSVTFAATPTTAAMPTANAVQGAESSSTTRASAPAQGSDAPARAAGRGGAGRGVARTGKGRRGRAQSRGTSAERAAATATASQPSPRQPATSSQRRQPPVPVPVVQIGPPRTTEAAADSAGRGYRVIPPQASQPAPATPAPQPSALPAPAQAPAPAPAPAPARKSSAGASKTGKGASAGASTLFHRQPPAAFPAPDAEASKPRRKKKYTFRPFGGGGGHGSEESRMRASKANARQRRVDALEHEEFGLGLPATYGRQFLGRIPAHLGRGVLPRGSYPMPPLPTPEAVSAANIAAPAEEMASALRIGSTLATEYHNTVTYYADGEVVDVVEGAASAVSATDAAEAGGVGEEKGVEGGDAAVDPDAAPGAWRDVEEKTCVTRRYLVTPQGTRHLVDERASVAGGGGCAPDALPIPAADGPPPPAAQPRRPATATSRTSGQSSIAADGRPRSRGAGSARSSEPRWEQPHQGRDRPPRQLPASPSPAAAAAAAERQRKQQQDKAWTSYRSTIRRKEVGKPRYQRLTYASAAGRRAVATPPACDYDHSNPAMSPARARKIAGAWERSTFHKQTGAVVRKRNALPASAGSAAARARLAAIREERGSNSRGSGASRSSGRPSSHGPRVCTSGACA